jgi:hypothetical protein
MLELVEMEDLVDKFLQHSEILVLVLDSLDQQVLFQEIIQVETLVDFTGLAVAVVEVLVILLQHHIPL